MNPTKRPSQKDIAQVAGVSQSVVSHVLNGSTAISISPATRQRVLEAIHTMGYIPNRAAQTLRSQKTMTVAAIIPDIMNPYYPEFIRGIQDTLQPRGYDLITFNTDGLAELEVKGVQAAIRSRVDGIVMNIFHQSHQHFRAMLGPQPPVVLLGHLAEEDKALANMDFVNCDGVLAAHAVTTYLIERGHRRIVMLSGMEMTEPRERRFMGYRQALEDHSLPVEDTFVFGGDFDEHGGYESMQKVLEMDPLPDAVFAANDLMAIGALKACREHGVRVPDDISIAGYDDIPVASLMNPPLTTINQQSREQGCRAAKLLLDRLDGSWTGPPRYDLVPFELIIRESA